MKIEMTIKGTTSEINTGKESVRQYMASRSAGTMYGKHVHGAFQNRANNGLDGVNVIVYHAEKHRRKVEVLDKPIKLTKKQLRDAYQAPQDGMVKRKIVKKAHWKVTIYVIPYVMLEMSNLKVIQESRTFKFEKI